MARQRIGKAVFVDENSPKGEPIVEMPVLLEAWQLAALEAAASAYGLTAATLVRCLLRDFLSCFEKGSPTPNTKSDYTKGKMCRVLYHSPTRQRG